MCAGRKSRHFFSFVIGDGSFVPLFEHFVLFSSLGELKILHLRNTKQQVKSVYFSKEIYGSALQKISISYIAFMQYDRRNIICGISLEKHARVVRRLFLSDVARKKYT